MATVNIKFSQNVIDQWQSLVLNGQGVAGSFGQLVDAIDAASNYIDANLAGASWNQVGSSIIVTYPDGTTETYTGVMQDNPAAASGHASVAGYTFREHGVLTLSASGRFNFDYTITPPDNILSIVPSSQGSTLQSFRVATDVPSASPDYDPVFGNTSIALTGALVESAAGELSGTIRNIAMGADKFLTSSSIDGHFVLDASLPGGIGGSLTAYQELYRDGSLATVGGVSVALNAAQNIGQDLLYGSVYYGGNDDINVDLPARLVNPTTLHAGAGDDRVALKGGGGLLGVAAGEGNDRITLLDNGHGVDGGSGLDTVVLASARAAAGIHRVTANPGQLVYTVTDAAGVVDGLTDVERIVFADGAYALDIDGHAGAAYRLYQAAFNRPPDAVGLGFWIGALDHGQSLASAAQGFIQSDEYRNAYGAAPSNLDLVTKFYANILHRAPDGGGLAFWVGALDHKTAGVADVLAAISESPENVAGLVGIIGDGFAYTPYGQA